MENTAIKVHVTSEIHGIIKDIQNNLRKKEGKKTSLAEIMLRLAQKGIQCVQNEDENGKNAQNNDNSAQNKENYTQNEAGLVQNSERFVPESKGKNLIISSKESKFIDELSIRQEYLSEREAEIRDLEVELYDEREKLIDKNRELLKLEEEILRKQYRTKYNSIESELIKKTNMHIGNVDYSTEEKTNKPDNSDIKNDISKLVKTHFGNVSEKFTEIKKQLSDIKREAKFENFTKYFEQLNDNDKKIIHFIERSNHKTTLQKLEPMLPAALTAFVTFIMKNKEKINTTEIANEIKALLAKEDEDKATS